MFATSRDSSWFYFSNVIVQLYLGKFFLAHSLDGPLGHRKLRSPALLDNRHLKEALL